MSRVPKIEIRLAIFVQILLFGLIVSVPIFAARALIRNAPTLSGNAALWLQKGPLLVVALLISAACAYTLWRLRRFHIIVDDETLTIRCDGISQRFGWHELATWAIEPVSERGKSGWWVKLRDATGTVRVEWDRHWCQLMGSDAKSMEFIQTKLSLCMRDEAIVETRTLRARPLRFQLTGWLMLCFFSFLAYGAWSKANLLMALIMLGVASGGIAMLMLSGTVEISAHEIAHLAPRNQKRVAWSEVTKIKTIQTNEIEWWIFHTETTTVSVPGPRHWWSRDKAEMLRLSSAQIRRHQIEVD